MRKECDLSVTHPIVRKQVQLHSTRCWEWDWILSFHQGSFAENPVALLQMEPWYSDLGAKVTFDQAKCASLQKMYHKYLQLKFCMQYPAKKNRLLRRYMPWPVLIGSLGVFHEVPCSVPQSSIIDTASPTIPTVFPLKHLSEMPFASHCKLFLPMSSGEALSPVMGTMASTEIEHGTWKCQREAAIPSRWTSGTPAVEHLGGCMSC